MSAEFYQRLLRPLYNRMRTIVRRAVIERIDDSLDLQSLQVSLMDGEVRDDVEHFQAYGLASSPPEESEALFLKVAGSHGVVIAANSRGDRLKDLEPGEVALFTKFGSKILLNKDGEITLTADCGSEIYLKQNGDAKIKVSGDVALDSATVNLAGDPADDYVALSQKVATELSSIQSSVNTFITAYNAHTHIITGSGIDTITGAPVTVTATAAVPASPGVSLAPPGSTAASKVKAS